MKFILGVLTFLIAAAVEEALLGAGLLPCIAEAEVLLTMPSGFRYEELEPVEMFMADAVLLLELLMAALAVLLGAAVVDVDVCVTTLGSVEGMGFPSLVCSFTT